MKRPFSSHLHPPHYLLLHTRPLYVCSIFRRVLLAFGVMMIVIAGTCEWGERCRYLHDERLPAGGAVPLGLRLATAAGMGVEGGGMMGLPPPSQMVQVRRSRLMLRCPHQRLPLAAVCGVFSMCCGLAGGHSTLRVSWLQACFRISWCDGLPLYCVVLVATHCYLAVSQAAIGSDPA